MVAVRRPPEGRRVISRFARIHVGAPFHENLGHGERIVEGARCKGRSLLLSPTFGDTPKSRMRVATSARSCSATANNGSASSMNSRCRLKSRRTSSRSSPKHAGTRFSRSDNSGERLEFGHCGGCVLAPASLSQPTGGRGVVRHLAGIALEGRGKGSEFLRDDITSCQSAALRTLHVIAEHVEPQATP